MFNTFKLDDHDNPYPVEKSLAPNQIFDKLQIESINTVLNDGFIMSKKGLNLPDTDFGGDILTPKDLADIEYGASCDYDYVALSFVQTADDILKLNAFEDTVMVGDEKDVDFVLFQVYHYHLVFAVEQAGGGVLFLFCFLLSAFVGDDFFNGAFCAETGGVVIELFARF